MTEILTQKYEFLVNNILDTIIEIDLKGNFIYISPQCFNIFGYHQSELIGTNGFDFIHPDDLPNIKKTISNAIIKNKPISIEFRTRHKEGHFAYISARGSLVNFNNKQTILAVGRDITKQKYLAQKLEESESIFNKITNQTFLGFVILQDFYIKYCNLAFSEAIGYTQEEMINWKKTEFLKIIHPNDREILFSLAQKVYNGDNEALDSFEFRMIKKSGDIIWSELHTKPIVYKGIKADLVFIQDITEKKLAEEKLRESEEKYRLITEHANDLIDVLNEKFQYEYINEKVHKRLLGYSEEDMLGKFAGKFVHSADLKAILEKLKEGFANGVGMAESRIKKKDGTYIWYESKGNIYRDKNGNKKALIISRDITDRKIAEDKILKSEALLSEAQRIAQLGHWEWNILSNELFWSDELYRIYKRPQDYKPTIKEWLQHVHPDDFELYFKSLKENISGGDVHNKDFRIITSDGELKHIHAEWEITRDNKNKPIRGFGTIIDITERKMAELKLKESEENYRNLVSNIPGAVFRCDQNWTMQYISNNIQKISGYPPSHFIFNTVRKYVNIIHPDDIKKVGQTLIDSIKQKIPVEVEYRIICNNGTIRWVHDNSMGAFNEKGEFIGFTGVIIDITDRKRAEQKLKESEENYRLITENVHDMITVFNKELKTEYINENVHKKLTGYSKTDLIGKSSLKFIHPDDIRRVIKDYNEKHEKGEGMTELRYKTKDRGYLWLEIKGRTFVDNDGEKKSILISRDITERKRAEQKLKESEEKYRVLFESSPYAVGLIDTKGTVVQGNSNFEKIFGYNKDEILGKSFREFALFSKEDSTIILDSFNELIRGEVPKPQELQIHRKDGTIIWVTMQASIVRLSNETLFQVITQNISEQKLAEKKLKESEEKYRLISENANDMIVIINKNSIIEYVNKRPLKIYFGYTPREVIGKDIKYFINPDYLESYGLNVKNLFKREKGIIELELRHKENYYCPVEVSVSIFIDMKNEPKQLIYVKDITGRKHAEQKLKESEEKYRLISEDTDDLISLYDENFNIEYINEQTHSRILGYSVKNLKDVAFKMSITHKDDVRTIITANRICFKKGKVTYQIRLKHKTGQYLWFETKGKVFSGQDDKKKVLFVSRDITERKIAEDELKAKELKYRTLIENLPQRIFLKDINSIYISCNKKYAEDLNLEADDILGKTDYDFYPRELADKYRLDDKRIIATGKAEEIDEIDILSGEDRYVRTIKTPIRDENNKITGLLAIFWDITARKKVEQQLKESEERFKIIYEYAPDAYYLINYNGKFIDGNKTAEELIGYKRDELIGKDFDKVLPKYQIKKALNIFSKNKKGLSTGPVELSIIHKSGKEIPVEIRTHPIKISDQLLVLGIARDISERKRAEKNLKESEEKYRLITENANDLIAILNDKFEHEFINEQVYLNILGYSNEDMLGKNRWDIIHPKDFTETIKKLKEGFTTGEGIVELRLRHKKGHYLWFEFKGKKYLDTEGNIWGLLTARDITQRKIVDLKLRESEIKYRNIIENAKEGYYEVDLKGNFTFFNDAFCKLFEYPPNELIGTNFKKYATEVMSKETFIAFNTVYKTGIEQKNFEFEVITKNDNIKYGEATIHLKYDTDGSIIGFSGFLRDVTEKKFAENKLRESEEKYRHIIENSPFAIILIDLEGKIKDCNSATLKIFGFSKEELINYNYLDLAKNQLDKLNSLKERFELLKQEEVLESADFQVYTKDRKKLWITSRLSQIKIGDETFFFAIIEDITEKKILENLMFELNQNFFHFTTDVKKNIQLLLQTAINLSKGTFVLYARQNFIKDNAKVEIISNENEVVNFDLDVFKKNYFMNKIFEHTHEIPQFFSDINENFESPEDPFIQKYNIKGAYGKIINSQNDFKSAICIFYQKNPEISYEVQLVLLLISDAIAIEEQRWQLLQKLEEQNKKLSEIDKLKSELLRRFSHELKTPLISIKGYSELILYQNKDLFDIDTISMIEEIKHGCLRLENLISELMKSSKLESGQIELRPIKDNLSFLIKFTVKELQGLAKTRNQNIILQIHEDLITKFEKERIHEVIGNLLTNSIKYTPPYGTIEIKSEIKEDYYIISVKDNGIGFTEKEKENLFKQFGKIEHYGRGSYISTEGTGLGLYICKKLIELHGGKIWMDSEGRNKGSIFYFSLPIIKE